MADEQIRVGINGYGVIGERVADAVSLQDDMKLLGVAEVGFDWRLTVAAERSYPFNASIAKRREEMHAAPDAVRASHAAFSQIGFEGAEAPSGQETD